MCVCIHVYMCKHVCVQAYMCMQMHACVNMFMYMCRDMGMYMKFLAWRGRRDGAGRLFVRRGKILFIVRNKARKIVNLYYIRQMGLSKNAKSFCYQWLVYLTNTIIVSLLLCIESIAFSLHPLNHCNIHTYLGDL